MKKTFILHNDSLEIEELLDNEQLGALFRAIIQYQKGVEIELSMDLKFIFHSFKKQFDRDLISYDKRCEAQSANGKKGGRPSKPKEANKPNGLLKKPIKLDSDSDSDSDNETDIKRTQYRKELEDIIVPSWNTIKDKDKNWKKTIKVNDDLVKAYKNIRKGDKDEFSDDWNTAIGNYLNEIQSRGQGDYSNHRYTLWEFMKRKGGYNKFINF